MAAPRKNAIGIGTKPKKVMPEGVRFQPGNPGRPVGSRHSVTIAIENMMDGEAERLSRKAITMALKGDMVALKLCLDRIAPVRRGRPVKIALPPIQTAADVQAAFAKITAETAVGLITPEEGAILVSIVEAQRRGIELGELAERMATIEQQLSDRPSAIASDK